MKLLIFLIAVFGALSTAEARTVRVAIPSQSMAQIALYAAQERTPCFND